MTTVVNLRQSAFDVYVGGPGKGETGYFGNPFAPMLYSGEVSREECLALFKRYFYFRVKTDPEFRKRVMELKGKTLGCFCAPKRCHGDIIIEYIHGQG